MNLHAPIGSSNNVENDAYLQRGGESQKASNDSHRHLAQVWNALPAEGFVRDWQIYAPKGPVPVSRATWWEGVRTGRFPRPTKFFGPGITAWDVREIRALLERAEASLKAADYGFVKDE